MSNLSIDGISFEKYNVEAEHQELKMQGFTIEALDNTRDYVPFMFYGITFEIGMDDDINTFFMFNEI